MTCAYKVNKEDRDKKSQIKNSVFSHLDLHTNDDD